MEILDFDSLKEEKICFDTFTNQDAFELGNYLSTIAIENKYPVLIHIEKNNELIYEYANDGASPDNKWWIEGKMNIVKHFHKSSAYISKKFEKRNMSVNDLYSDKIHFVAAPGAVPIRMKSAGVIGVIAISGLDSISDHELIIKGLRYLLNQQMKR